MIQEEEENELIYVFFSQKETIYYTEPIQQIQAKIEQDLLENPNDIKKLTILAQIQSKFNLKDDESLRIYKKILMLDPTNIDAKIDIELICFKNHQFNFYDNINVWYNIDPGYWRTHYIESLKQMYLNNLNLALKIIENAHLQFPNDCWITMFYAQQLSDLKIHSEKVKNLLDDVISKCKLDYEVMLRISYSYGRIDKRNEYLVKYLYKALSLNPNSQKTNNALGYYFRTVNNDYDACITYCERAIELDKNYEDAYYNISVCYEMKGEYEKSMNYIKKYYELKSSDIEILSDIASQSYHNLNDYDYSELILSKLLKKKGHQNQYNIFIYLIVQQYQQSQNKKIDLEANEQNSLNLLNLLEEKGIEHDFIEKVRIQNFINILY